MVISCAALEVVMLVSCISWTRGSSSMRFIVSLLPLVGEGDVEQGVLAGLDLLLGLTDSQQVV